MDTRDLKAHRDLASGSTGFPAHTAMVHTSVIHCFPMLVKCFPCKRHRLVSEQVILSSLGQTIVCGEMPRMADMWLSESIPLYILFDMHH